MLLRMLGYSDAAGDFAVSDAAAFAWRIGLTHRELQGALSRGDVAESTCDALRFCYKDSTESVIQRLIAGGVCTGAAASALGLLTSELTARQTADRYLSAGFQLVLYRSQEDARQGNPSANASGFFIRSDGLAVTNYHAIRGALSAAATLMNGESYPVERVLYYDPDIDIAVLKVSQTSTAGRTASAFNFLEVAGTADICPGDTVYAIGNPLGYGLVISSGIIGSTGQKVDRYALPVVVNSADISQGSSGGALINVYGQVIAVTSGAYTYGNNMFLAVPADPVLTADLTEPGWTLAEVAHLTGKDETDD